jgi:hypothetical protein
MKNRIESVIARIGKTMQEQLATQQFDSIANMSPLLGRARHLQKQYEKIEQELPEVEDLVRKLTDPNGCDPVAEPKATSDNHQKNGRAVPQTIRVLINWRANKRNKDDEEIYFLKATDTMAELIARLIEELGKDALDKLLQVRVNRGPLLSYSPNKDFGGYQFKNVRGTSVSVLTHSSTSEKIGTLQRICSLLGMAPGSVQIKAEDRY